MDVILQAHGFPGETPLVGMGKTHRWHWEEFWSTHWALGRPKPWAVGDVGAVGENLRHLRCPSIGHFEAMECQEAPVGFPIICPNGPQFHDLFQGFLRLGVPYRICKVDTLQQKLADSGVKRAHQ